MVEKAATYPPDIGSLIRDIISIDKLLVQYDKTDTMFCLKEAAAKIKSNTPMIKALAGSELIKANLELKQIVKHLMLDLKKCYLRAKQVLPNNNRTRISMRTTLLLISDSFVELHELLSTLLFLVESNT